MTSMLRTERRAAVACAALVLLVACGTRPPAPDGQVAVTVNALGTTVATVVVIVSAADIPMPLVFNLTLSNGTAAGTIRVPPGELRAVGARAYESDGALAYEGSVILSVVERGPNPPVTIPMVSRAGQVPITVQIGPVSIVVTPGSETISVGEALQLETTITSAGGDVIEAEPAWATSDPTVLSVTDGGFVMGLREGQAEIVATYAGVAGVSAISVSPIEWSWVRQIGTPAYDMGYAIAVDGQGAAVVAGVTGGTFPGNTSTSSGDAFVAQLDPSGAVAWVTQFGTVGWGAPATDVALDAWGRVHVAGYTGGTFEGNTSAGGTDAFVATLDALGTVSSVRQFGTPGEELVASIAVDEEGSAYVSGYTSGTFAGSASAGGYDVFVARLDAAGNLSWIRQFGTPSNERADEIAVDAGGGIYVAGVTSGSLAGNASAGSDDAFVARLDGSGNISWIRQFGTELYDEALAISVSPSGTIHVAGLTSGTLAGNAGAGGDDAFLASLDSAGTIGWLRQFGTSSLDVARGIAADAGGEYVVGYTEGSFGTRVSAGGVDAFVARLDGAGNVSWIEPLGTAGNEYGTGLAVDPTGAVYTVGLTDGALEPENAAGGPDAFVAKLFPVP